MRCPFCGHEDTQVKDSRPTDDNSAIRRRRYCPKDTLTSLGLGFGSSIADVLSGGLVFALAVWVHRFSLVEIPYAWWAFALCFVLDDLAYYVFHRTAHRVRWFWASHVIHHSSQHYNLSTALRQPLLTPFTGPWFWMPLPLIGFPPYMVLTAQAISLLYQFWLHTEAIDRLGPLEWIFNTPSHHRVHHARNLKYLDKNYAGMLIIWDRMFGTFVEEKQRPTYGLTKPVGTYNLIKLQYGDYAQIVRNVRGAASLRDKLGYLFGPPGWEPRPTDS